jgi:hypothetical protein
MNNELQSGFENKLKQSSEAILSGLSTNTAAFSSSVARARNTIKNNINLSSISNCVQNSLSSQNMSISGIDVSCPGYCNSGCPIGNTCDMSKCNVDIQNISQQMVLEAVGKCVSNQQSATSSISKVSNDISLESKSKNEGLDLSMLSSLSVFLIPMIISVVIVISMLLVSCITTVL